MSTVLYEDEWATLTLDPATSVVRYVRSPKPFATLEELDRTIAALVASVPAITPGMKLLIDVRRAPARNDEAFEARISAALVPVLRRVSRTATLVQTVVGKLQVARVARQRSSVAHVFDDERAALAYLTGP